MLVHYIMIKLSNLTFGYVSSYSIFQDSHLRLEHPGIYGILGLNGSGKTTFLKLLAGLLFPKSGDIEVFGFSPNERLLPYIQNIYFVADEFTLPNGKVSSFEQWYASFYPAFDHSFYHHCLNEFGLSATNKVKSLSYGERKKVMISFALATQCKLLLLDEPTNGLDIPAKAIFRKLLAAMAGENRYILISTHQVRDLENLMDTLLILHNGKWIAHDSIPQLCSDYCFRTLQAGDLPEDILYAEGGLCPKALLRNKHGEETRMDVELYFNAMISQARKEMVQNKN